MRVQRPSISWGQPQEAMNFSPVLGAMVGRRRGPDHPPSEVGRVKKVTARLLKKE